MVPIIFSQIATKKKLDSHCAVHTVYISLLVFLYRWTETKLPFFLSISGQEESPILLLSSVELNK